MLSKHTAHRQVALLLVKAPPMIGPRSVPRPHVSPVRAMYIGRSCGVVVTDKRVITPTYIPAPPTPQTTRPMMRAFKLGAAPQMAEPASNIKTVTRYRCLALNWPYILPLRSPSALKNIFEGVPTLTRPGLLIWPPRKMLPKATAAFRHR